MAERPNTIDAYLEVFEEGGTRQYLFLVTFNLPVSIGLSNKEDLKFYVRTSSLPESSYEDVSIPYPGYSFKMAGNRTYGDWTVSLNVDRNAYILKAFQLWHNLIYNPQTHEYSAPVTYMKNQTLLLLGPDLKPTSEYTLYGTWPKSVGNVALDYSSSEIVTVDITFAYQYYMCKEQESNAS